MSHTWVNKLVKKFEADPERMRRKMAAFAPASLEKLERAREETRWEREHGRLRGPIRWRRVKVAIQGKKETVVATTRVERQRRQEEIDGERARLRGESAARVEMQRDSASRAGAASSAPTKAGAMPVAYREVPEWARGVLMPGEVAMALARSAEAPMPGMMGKPASAGKPRMVKFARRRR